MQKVIIFAAVMATMTLSPVAAFAKAEKTPKPGSHMRHQNAVHHRSTYQMPAAKPATSAVAPKAK